MKRRSFLKACVGVAVSATLAMDLLVRRPEPVFYTQLMNEPPPLTPEAFARARKLLRESGGNLNGGMITLHPMHARNFYARAGDLLYGKAPDE